MSTTEPIEPEALTPESLEVILIRLKAIDGVKLPESVDGFLGLSVGSGLYRICSPPSYVPYLHVGDLVCAQRDEPDDTLELLTLVHRGDHQTVRLFFTEVLELPAIARLLKDFEVQFGVVVIDFDPVVMLDVGPHVGVPALRAHLDALAAEDVLKHVGLGDAADDAW